MIDLHCHLLPSIDDGARNISESIALAKVAYESGITHVVCTPHIHDGYFNNDIEIIESTHVIFKSALEREGIPLKSHFAAEVRINPNIVAMVQKDRVPFLGYLDGQPVLLLELPHSHIPPGTEQLIAWLKKQGIVPMIAHPERNRDILANYSKANWLRGKGVLFQLTAGAITGTFGQRVQDCVFKLLNDGFADIIATDAHNMSKRPPELAGAYQLVKDEFGEASAADLCTNNPLEIARCWF
ncbi:tyrosine-protein phosphatase [Alteromonas gracilis]|uniref:tyrosine-protein phosphatase n=1 Tax=Alteromonas gracilis TaxID=1479524 RepID=UPI002FE41918